MIDMWLKTAQFAGAVGRLVYPDSCAICAAPGEGLLELCTGCRAELPWNRHACPRCALSLPAGSGRGLPCAACQQSPPPFEQGWSAFRYDGTLRWLHRQLKFGRRLAYRQLLSQLLAGALQDGLAQGQLARPDCLLVMPLHPRRLMRRGFNQSLELVRPAAQSLAMELDYRSLRRLRSTRPQSQLAAGQRRRNLRGAFACERDLSGMHVALFDDVVTTGETMAEAARCLRRAGALEISVWSLARTPARD